MKKSNGKQSVVQKPFRCPVELDVELNRTKGALMMKTGSRISDNSFMIELLELGLEKMKEKNKLDIPELS